MSKKLIGVIAIILTALGMAGCGGGSVASGPPSSTVIVSLSSNSLDFGTVTLGSNSIQTVTLTNNGTADLTITAAPMAGATASAFTLSGPSTPLFPLTVTAGTSKTITITFAPSTAGANSATVNLTSNATGGTTSFTLTGNGGGGSGNAIISIGPAPLNFGNINLGSNSGLNVTISNTGTTDLTVSGATVTGTNASAFTLSGAVNPLFPMTITAGTGKTITVTFAPTIAGVTTATVTFTTNAVGGSNSLTVTGAGVGTAQINVSTSTLNFGSVSLGANKPLSFTVSNTGNSDLIITAGALSGANAAAFTLSGAANPLFPLTITAGTSKTITVTFAPTAVGANAAALDLVSNAAFPPNTILLSGTGVGSAVIGLSQTSLNFSNVNLGASSNLNVTVSNTGNVDLVVTAASVTGTNASAFTLSGATTPLFPLTITAGTSKTITVTFAPTVVGANSATVTLTSNAASGPNAITLAGVGVGSAIIALNPPSLNFGSVTTSTGTSLSVMVNNTGNGPLTITAGTISGANAVAFALSGVVFPVTINPGASQSITVTFTPTATGANNATVTFASNAVSGTNTLPLTGNGTAPVGNAIIGLAPPSINFNNVNLGSNASLNMTVSNTGTTMMTVSAGVVSGANAAAFTLSGVVFPFTIAAGNNQVINVTFAPTAAGTNNATVSLTSDAISGTSTFNVTGNGVGNAVLGLNPASLSFGNVNIGSSANLPITVSNTGNVNLVITAMPLTGANPAVFTLNGATVPLFPLTIAPGASQNLTVTYTPTTAGNNSATVNITSNASSGPNSFAVDGTGIGSATFNFSPSAASTLDFGNVAVNATKQLNLTVTNTGNITGSITNATLAGTGLSFVPSLVFPINIPAGQSTVLTLQYAPTSTTSIAGGSLVITNNTAVTPVNFTVTGTGVLSQVSLSPNPIAMGSVKVSKSVTQTVTISNVGGVSIDVTGVSVSGSDLTVSSTNLPVTLNPGGTTTVDVTFAPQSTGAATGTLSVTSTAPSSPDTAPITGTGLTSFYYISPNGSDSNDALTQATPVKTFAKAFSKMSSGDELIMLDGDYTQNQNGLISAFTSVANSGVPPNGTAGDFTVVRALNDGKVRIIASDATTSSTNLFLGRSTTKASYLKFQGMTFEAGQDQLFNTDHIYFKNVGFHSQTQSAGAVFTIGQNSNDMGNTYILLEDSFVWGKERIMLISFRSDHIIFRRVVVRNDGCDSSTFNCGNNSGNAMVGVTTYLSSQVSLENVVVLDSVIGPGGVSGAGDLYTAFHFGANAGHYLHPFGQNEWLGTIGIQIDRYRGYGPETDDFDTDPTTMLNPVWSYENIVNVQTAVPGLDTSGFNADISGGCTGTCPAADIIVRNATIIKLSGTTADGFRIGPNLKLGANSKVENLLVSTTGRYAINSSIVTNFVASGGSYLNGTFNQTTCQVGCNLINTNVLNVLLYPPRIETGSIMSGAGNGGTDIGANVRFRYGVDGSFWGDTGYKTLGTTPLWPWPNEARVFKEMCTNTGVSRGFCGTTSLTTYVWTLLGQLTPPATF